MKMIHATGHDRKSGGAQWRDLRFLFLAANKSTDLPLKPSRGATALVDAPIAPIAPIASRDQ